MENFKVCFINKLKKMLITKTKTNKISISGLYPRKKISFLKLNQIRFKQKKQLVVKFGNSNF
jgi:hypothetical protein